MRPTAIERARAKVGKPNEHGCREWLGFVRDDDRCLLQIASGLPHGDARRMLYEDHFDVEVPAGFVLPRCPRSRTCVEPTHQGDALDVPGWCAEMRSRRGSGAPAR